MPESSFERLRGDEIPASAQATLLRCSDYPDDYLGQQVSKLHADEFTDAALVATHRLGFNLPCCVLVAGIAEAGRPSRRSSSVAVTAGDWRRLAPLYR